VLRHKRQVLVATPNVGNLIAVTLLAALVGSRCNPVLRDFYQHLRQKGKPGKVALTALKRKLVVHLNSQLKTYPPQLSPC
jgi:transposase